MGMHHRTFRRLMMRGGAISLNGAQTLLDGEANGLGFDFTDMSALIKDQATPANNYVSAGDILSGALVGPGGKLTYTAPSLKICRQADGYYKYGAHNLYLNSAAPANQSITTKTGCTYAVTITGTVSITASGAATGTWTAGTNTFTAATTTLTLGSTTGAGTVHVRETPSVSTYVATAGAIKVQLPYSYSSGLCEGILVEEARTNLALYSKSFSASSWTHTELTQTTDGTLGPDGTAAQLFKQTTANSAHRSYLPIALANTTTYSISVYAKRFGSAARLELYSATAGSELDVVFDFSGGGTPTISSAGGANYVAASAAVESVGDGWYRLSARILTTSISHTYQIRQQDSGGNAVFVGVVTDGFYLWGQQHEVGSFATSPIITGSASVTRAADSGLTMATSLYPHSATVGTAMVRYKPLSASAAMVALRLDDGTANEVISVGHSAAAAIGLTVTDGGAGQTAPLTDGTATVNTFEKLAVSWKANDFLFSDNGATAVADTSGTLPTVTSIDIGPTLTGIISHVLVLPVEKSAAEVAEIATP